MKKFTAMLLCVSMSVCLFTGCGTKADEKAEVTEEIVEEDVEPSTGDATLDNTLNQDEIGEKELLVASFGTSFNDSRRLSIGGIENAVIEAFPEFSVRRGFTSQIIIDHVAERDGVEIDNITQALDRAVDNGVKTLVVQPTHLMNGIEYNELVDTIAEYVDAFEEVRVGSPLLTSDEDFKAVAEIIVDATKEFDDGETAIVFMGHGTEADSNGVYEKMQNVLNEMGRTNYIIGTVEAEPSLDDVIEAVRAGGYKKAVLRPLMIVAGDHANNDMAGSDEDSWVSRFNAEGVETECVLEGLGELEGIQQLIVKHTQDAVNSLDD